MSKQFGELPARCSLLIAYCSPLNPMIQSPDDSMIQYFGPAIVHKALVHECFSESLHYC
jgi:hypothetical protein